ncbi:O-acyltransferase like protein-like [Ptychodera flava]|uniref:O-acyltransferase like protein-like n=1 Tax=Ptychodera flava TaxID=63121 RepID=UPI00396A84E1
MLNEMVKIIKAALSTVAVIVLLGRFVEAQNVMDATFVVLARTHQNDTNTTNPLKAVTMPCYRDTVQYMLDFNTSKTYARSMYYSTGGIRLDMDLTWNIKDVGDFTMCRRSVRSEMHGTSFVGKYCLTDTNVNPIYELTIGVCLPNSCSDEDVQILVRAGYFERDPALPSWTDTRTMCSPVSYPWRWSDFLAIFICVVLSVFIVCCTIYDIIRRRRKIKKKKEEASKISPENSGLQNLEDNGEVQESAEGPTPVQNRTTLTAEVMIEEPSQPPISAKDSKTKGKLADVAIAFSILDTGSKILNTNPAKGSIGCLNGIRVISMFWIIVFHTWLFLTGIGYLRNVRYVQEYIKTQHAAYFLINGELGVEAFFVLGGLLVSYLTLKQIDKSGGARKVSWLRFFAHRYLRLTPAYAFILLLYSTITIHMGEGIWWPYWYPFQHICNTWWANLLYIHNWYPFPGSTSECMGWSWYLSVDMQLYFISPLFIVLLYNRWVIGIVVSVITTLCSFAISAYLNFALSRSIGTPHSYGEPALPEGSWLYTKPYYRITQYLIGIILGYVLFRLKGKKVKIHKVLNVFLWCCSTIVAYLVIYGPYFSTDENPTPQAASILYLSTHRFLLSACIGWVIFACATGNGGPVDRFLSWRGWLPLARVNYCAYLLHLTVILMYTWSLKYLWFYSNFNLAAVSIAMVAITYALAVIFTMVIEIPIIGLEKIFFPVKNKKN